MTGDAPTPPRVLDRAAVAWALMTPVFAVATARAGWPAVPVLALAFGGASAALGPWVRAAMVGGAAAAGWGALLAYTLVRGRAGDVARLFGGLAGLPPGAATAVAAALTLALGFALAWSAAAVAEWVVGALVARRRRAGRSGAVSAGPMSAGHERSGVANPGPVTLPATDAVAPSARTSAAAPP